MRRRALILVTHLLGAGHLTRAAAIARALSRAGHAVTLVSGGMPTPLVTVGGISVVQLPPVRAAVDDFTTLLDEDGKPATPARLAARRDLILATHAELRPDIVVTELYPFGRRVLADEFVALVEAAAAARPRPLIACSIRDILVAPAKVAKVEAAHALVRRSYDAVLVHGEESVIPLEASWPVDPELRARLFYTGYVDGSEPWPGPVEVGLDGPILVSGGSSAAALPLYRAAIEAASLGPPTRRWHILVGHGVTEDALDALRRDAPSQVEVERARPDFRACLSRAAIFVGQAGYNTVMDILVTRARAVLVPFERGQETEQRLRAGELARRGLADLLPEAELDGATLAERVEAAARRPRPQIAGMRLDGAERTAQVLCDLAARPQRSAWSKP